MKNHFQLMIKLLIGKFKKKITLRTVQNEIPLNHSQISSPPSPC